jgi:hypothetical protein
MKLGEYVQWERKVGEPIYQQDGRTIRPISRVLSVWWRPYGGAVWNRPTAVEVEEGGVIEVVPIIPVTFWAQVGISTLVIVIGLLLGTAIKRRS